MRKNQIKNIFFCKMINILLFGLSMIVSPCPPMNPPIKNTKFGGGDNWSLITIDLQRATELLTTFYKSYETAPDFSCSPLKMTAVPQGILGLSKNGKVKLVFHFLENDPGIASITSIAIPNDEYEAGEKLFDFIDDLDFLMIDEKEIQSQPKWALASQFHKK